VLGEYAPAILDGKITRRLRKLEATPLCLMSSFAAEAGLVLGQRTTVEKSNEKTAIPELLAMLALTGCIVTHVNRVVRLHWRVENTLHWCMDVAFGDD